MPVVGMCGLFDKGSNDMGAIHNGQSYLDGREVIKARDALQNELDALRGAVEDADGEDAVEARSELNNWLDSNEFDELQALIAFCAGFEDYDAHANLIHRKKILYHINHEILMQYADNETFEELRAYIDLDSMVEDMLKDYNQADYDGVTYYYS
jgi:hypothetical protein